MTSTLDQTPLGKTSEYLENYTPELLYAIPRELNRKNFQDIIFFGEDVWDAFEVSWLNPKGKPVVALAQFVIPCDSPNLIESKSLKLYLNSFNQTKFSCIQSVCETIGKDLVQKCESNVQVFLRPIEEVSLKNFEGFCLDMLDIEIDEYEPNPNLLKIEDDIVEEKLYTNLFKSNCLITGQPDWATISIVYKGKKINHESLLKYLLSFRKYKGFHEHCAELIFVDLTRQCLPELLNICASFTRRGGVSICCNRSSIKTTSPTFRSIRQ